MWTPKHRFHLKGNKRQFVLKSNMNDHGLRIQVQVVPDVMVECNGLMKFLIEEKKITNQGPIRTHS